MLLQLLNHAESCTLHVHGTIIWRGITCKKTPCYMCNSAAGGLLLKMLNIYVKYFWIFPLKRNCRILIGLCKVFMNRPIMFLDRDNKTKLVPAYLIFRLDHVFSRRFGQRLQPIFKTSGLKKVYLWLLGGFLSVSIGIFYFLWLGNGWGMVTK